MSQYRAPLAKEPAMIRFVRVVTAAEIPSDRGRPVFVDGKVVALFKVDGAIHALDDSCPHAGSSLSAGKLEGAFVQCRGHGLRFDVRTGRMRGVDGYCAKTYPVRVTDGEVAIGIDCGESAEPGGDAPPPASLWARRPQSRSTVLEISSMSFNPLPPGQPIWVSFLPRPTLLQALRTIRRRAGTYVHSRCRGLPSSQYVVLSRIARQGDPGREPVPRGRRRVANALSPRCQTWRKRIFAVGRRGRGIAIAINPALPATGRGPAARRWHVCW